MNLCCKYFFSFFRSILLPILLLTFTIRKVIYAQIHNTHTGLYWFLFAICVLCLLHFAKNRKTEKQTHFHYITWNKYNFSKHTVFVLPYPTLVFIPNTIFHYVLSVHFISLVHITISSFDHRNKQFFSKNKINVFVEEYVQSCLSMVFILFYSGADSVKEETRKSSCIRLKYI